MTYATRAIGGRFRCIDGYLWRHDPQHDDPYLETKLGKCPDCDGTGCVPITIAPASDNGETHD